ncbi:hypothetical protein AB0J55_17710 [Amycolatopsis sp. NPDC049688]|uniref:Acb2/Tad1 domain-containing protein n=1 Tax=Amycolatopsis sp. NPDC049688 TaxID=3154733 RepID=UPI00342A0298
MSAEEIDTGSQNVTGYRKQTPDALDTVNEIKHTEEVVAKLWRWVRARPNVPTDPRQLALARTAFEEGFMHLNRAVFQPVDPFEGD